MEAPRIVTGPSFSYDPGTMPEELGIDPTIIQVRASTEWIWGTTVHATASMRYFATNGELDLQVQVNSPTGASVTTPKVTEAKYHYIPILPSTTINANTISVVATECGHSAGTFANGLAYHSAPSPAGILQWGSTRKHDTRWASQPECPPPPTDLPPPGQPGGGSGGGEGGGGGGGDGDGPGGPGGPGDGSGGNWVLVCYYVDYYHNGVLLYSVSLGCKEVLVS